MTIIEENCHESLRSTTYKMRLLTSSFGAARVSALVELSVEYGATGKTWNH